jgi:RNA polymerase sigma-70 factor (ECF subfamily)
MPDAPTTVEEARARLQALLAQITEGSEEAARELVEEYGPIILRVVRSRLHKKLRSKFDSMDFTQSVWASFFANRRTLAGLRGPEAIIAYLVELARSKVSAEHRRRFRLRKHDIHREVPFAVHAVGSERHPQLAGNDPTPSEAVSLQETWDNLQRKMPTNERRLLDLLWEGKSLREIAQMLGVSERTIQRVFHKLKNRTDR